MQALDDTSRKVLIEELNLHKTEFSAIRDEILHWIDGQKQYLNLSLVAIAAGLGFTPLISQQKAFIILLLFPLVFHVLLWEMLNSRRLLDQLSAYLVETLIPRVNTILDKLGDDREGTIALGWEFQVRTHSYSTPEKLLASLTPSLHWVPILAVGALIISYATLATNQGYTPSSGEIALFILNLVLLIFAAVRNAMAAREQSQQAYRLRTSKNIPTTVQTKSVKSRNAK